MTQFTRDNTDGQYTTIELDNLNAAHAALLNYSLTQWRVNAEPEQIAESIADELNNVWQPNLRADELVRLVMGRTSANVEA